ncbi:MAG: NrtA/SsuA/CpmA family ABC transporter substrate-binding protein [Magnetococcales bacterium]|nr:NrtA/SsuA/CpmA family ABC transporter substrate-binding protein [Magnetococcales bacterium]
MSSPSQAETSLASEAHGVVTIGVQPLWLPNSLVTAVMQRDTLLRQSFLRKGVQIRFPAFLKGADVNRALHEGKLDGGFAGDMPTITACVSDQVHVVSLADLHFVSIVARTPLTISQLRGRRIGYAPGSNAHYAILATLAAAQLSAADVTLLPMPVHALPKALELGRIDAFGAWEPTPAIAEKMYKHKIIHRFLSSGYLYFTPAFAKQHADWVHWLVAAQIRALNWMMQEDDHRLQAILWMERDAEQLEGREFVLTHEESKRVAQYSIRRMRDMPLIPEEDFAIGGRLERASRFLSTIGLLPAELPWSSVRDCLHREIGLNVLSDPQHYQINTFSYGGQE